MAAGRPGILATVVSVLQSSDRRWEVALAHLCKQCSKGTSEITGYSTSTLKNSTFSDLTADYYRTPILSCEHEDPFRDDHWSTARRHVRSGYVMSGVKNAVGYRAGGAKGTGSGNQHPDTVCDIQTSRHGTHHHGGNPGRRKNTEHRTGHITPSYEPPPTSFIIARPSKHQAAANSIPVTAARIQCRLEH